MSNPNAPQGPQFQGPQQPYGQQPPQGYSQQQPPQGYGQQPLSHRDAKAQARGAKAQAKALRPWFKKKRSWVAALVALFVIIGIGNSLGGEPAPVAGTPVDTSNQPAEPTEEATEEATEEPSEEAPEPKPEPEIAGIGDSVEAGDWEFKATKFKCGETTVGNQYLNKKAQGQFCFLNITATNNGNDEGTIDNSSQKLRDADGKEYSSDSEASIYEDSDSNLFLEGVNPGNTAKGLLIFDVPKKAKPTEAVLSGGFFGGEDAVISLR
jgi:hypothetical protein